MRGRYQTVGVFICWRPVHCRTSTSPRTSLPFILLLHQLGIRIFYNFDSPHSRVSCFISSSFTFLDLAQKYGICASFWAPCNFAYCRLHYFLVRKGQIPHAPSPGKCFEGQCHGSLPRSQCFYSPWPRFSPQNKVNSLPRIRQVWKMGQY